MLEIQKDPFRNDPLCRSRVVGWWDLVQLLLSNLLSISGLCWVVPANRVFWAKPSLGCLGYCPRFPPCPGGVCATRGSPLKPQERGSGERTRGREVWRMDFWGGTDRSAFGGSAISKLIAFFCQGRTAGEDFSEGISVQTNSCQNHPFDNPFCEPLNKESRAQTRGWAGQITRAFKSIKHEAVEAWFVLYLPLCFMVLLISGRGGGLGGCASG